MLRYIHWTWLCAAAASVCVFMVGVADAQVRSCGGDIPEEGYACECSVTFGQTYSGSYRHGEPYDCLTIEPDGSGETFAERGITIRVRVKCILTGYYVVGFPAEKIVLYAPNLCICPGGNIADHATDENGYTEFSGTIRAGGCTNSLTLFVDGQFVTQLPIRINSTDTGVASPCYVDACEVAALAIKLGRPDLWSLCFDYNESGPPIDASDLAYLAHYFGATCR